MRKRRQRHTLLNNERHGAHYVHCDCLKLQLRAAVRKRSGTGLTDKKQILLRKDYRIGKAAKVRFLPCEARTYVARYC